MTIIIQQRNPLLGGHNQSAGCQEGLQENPGQLPLGFVSDRVLYQMKTLHPTLRIMFPNGASITIWVRGVQKPGRI